jgi:ribosomal protein S26
MGKRENQGRAKKSRGDSKKVFGGISTEIHEGGFYE